MIPVALSKTAAELSGEIKKRGPGNFESLLTQWEKQRGTEVVPPLLEVAGNRSANTDDSHRYIALMGIAKIGGSAAAPLLIRFLKDESWMLRSGALRALSALKNPKTYSAVLPLLQDPALVVRLEAVEAVKKLKPEGAANALISAIEFPANYHGGRAQWVPQKALLALEAVGTEQIVYRLRPLLDHDKDPALLKQTLSTLHKLTGKQMSVRNWKRTLTALN